MKKSDIISQLRKKNKKRKNQSIQLLQKNRKPFNINGSRPAWKSPAFLLPAILMTVILIIPTLIVVPFMSDSEKTAAENSTEEVEVSMGTSPFSVEVMRANSEEVESVPLETYVSRVVASETPAEFEMEALKAQALAARTFIVNRLLNQNVKDEADVTDTTRDQVYHNEQELKKTMGSAYEEDMAKVRKAVAATEGEILTYNNNPITAAYFSTSNGYTENSEDYWENEVPYLRSVESPWDTDTPKFMDQKIFTIKKVEKLLETDLPASEAITMDVSKTEGNRVAQLKIGDKAFSGRKVRETLGLNSSDFSIEKKRDHLIFTTKGYGHGIGMSQFGANGMAKEGKTYKDIVKHYYQDVEISTVTNTAPTLVSK